MSCNLPTVSVLMSVYSEPLDWVKQAIDSILTQTFSDFEFIIINDKPDREELADFLKKEAENDARIKIHTNAKNIGLTKSLNVGLKLCTGKYIARMDADDISLPKRFEKQVAFMEQNKDVIVCGTNIRLVGEFHPLYVKTIFEKDIDIRGQMFYNSGFAHPTVMIRKKTLDETGIRYDELYRSAQDYKLWYDLRNSGKFANLSEKLLQYRLSNLQITKKISSNQQDNRAKINELFRRNYAFQNKTLQAYYERSIAYKEQTFNKLIKVCFSRYTNISLKERFAQFVRAILSLGR